MSSDGWKWDKMAWGKGQAKEELCHESRRGLAGSRQFRIRPRSTAWFLLSYIVIGTFVFPVRFVVFLVPWKGMADMSKTWRSWAGGELVHHSCRTPCRRWKGVLAGETPLLSCRYIWYPDGIERATFAIVFGWSVGRSVLCKGEIRHGWSVVRWAGSVLVLLKGHVWNHARKRCNRCHLPFFYYSIWLLLLEQKKRRALNPNTALGCFARRALVSSRPAA